MAKRHRELTQQRAEETRARILQKAREHFAEHGFDGASVREIASLADMTHSMITYHFGTKDRLWEEAVRDMFERLDRDYLGALPEREEVPVADRFTILTESYVRYCAEHPEHARITIAETIRGGHRLQWMIENFVRENHKLGLPLFEDLLAAGYCHGQPAVHLFYSWVAMCQLPFVLAKEAEISPGIEFLDDVAVRQQTETILAMFLGRARG